MSSPTCHGSCSLTFRCRLIHSIPIAESTASVHTPLITSTIPVTPVVPRSPTDLPVMEPTAGAEPILIHEDAASIAQSMRTAAAHHTEEIQEIVNFEREQMATEWADFAAKRERIMEEFQQYESLDQMAESWRNDAASSHFVPSLSLTFECIRLAQGRPPASSSPSFLHPFHRAPVFPWLTLPLCPTIAPIRHTPLP